MRMDALHWSLGPSFTYDFSLSAGWQVRAGTYYGIDLYPEYAWNDAPGPDSSIPFPETSMASP